MRDAPAAGARTLATSLPAWAAALLVGLTTALAGAVGVAAGAPAGAAVPTISPTTWYSLVNWRSRDTLGIDAASPAPGASVTQQAAGVATHQKFRFIPVAGGLYELQAQHSGLVVGIDARTGSLATQRVRSGTPTEQFSIAPGSSGRIKLISRASGMALGVVGASKVDGSRLDQARDTNATHQQWTLVSRDAVTATTEAAATPTAEPSAAPAPVPAPLPVPHAAPALTLTYLYPLVDPTAGPGAANAGPRQLIGVDPGHSTTPGVVLPSTVCVPSGVEIVRTTGLAEADVPTWILPGSSLPAGVTVASEHNRLEHHGLSSDCGDGTLPEDTTPDEVTPIEPPVSRPAPAPAPAPAPNGSGTWAPWPTATASRKVSATIKVTGTFDGNLTEYYGLSSGDQTEGQPPMFELADGARIKNVILGVGAGDGIHCRGTCTVENVWWLDVGEDAATFKGTSATQTMTVVGGGARKAADKVFQHNGPGTFVIRDFQVEGFGKLYRSCGNCSKQYARTVVVDDVRVQAPGKSVVGINSNLGDRATLTRLTVVGDPYRKISVCDEYRGVTSGEPTKVASGPSTACGYTASDVTYR